MKQRRTMRRLASRTLGAVVGAVLGLIAGGFVPSDWTARGSSYAAAATGESAKAGGEGHEKGKYSDLQAASELIPTEGSIDFMPAVAMAIVGLFAGALVIGLAARGLGLVEPNVAASIEDQAAEHHDDHGHDDSHGHGHGDSHGGSAGHH